MKEKTLERLIDLVKHFDYYSIELEELKKELEKTKKAKTVIKEFEADNVKNERDKVSNGHYVLADDYFGRRTFLAAIDTEKINEDNVKEKIKEAKIFYSQYLEQIKNFGQACLFEYIANPCKETLERVVEVKLMIRALKTILCNELDNINQYNKKERIRISVNYYNRIKDFL